jgi:predicted metal-dependent enzyme (double-stranded beta helix superfamily)
MCQFENAGPTANGQDEWILDNPRMREFIGAVKEIRDSGDDQKAILAAIRPHFEQLLADETWLPARYQEPFEASGMGSGIGMWLLYRAGDGSLAFSSLVVPPSAQTPVHDHLAWGLVGLYRGEQDEVNYRREDDGSDEGTARLSVMERHALKAGDFYELLPENDIHHVRTISDATSVSLHLLGIDNGCIVRHRYFPDEEKVVPFKSGYVNKPCVEDEEPAL